MARRIEVVRPYLADGGRKVAVGEVIEVAEAFAAYLIAAGKAIAAPAKTPAKPPRRKRAARQAEDTN